MAKKKQFADKKTKLAKHPLTQILASQVTETASWDPPRPAPEPDSQVFELKDEAKKFGVDGTYIDDLLKDTSLKPHRGTLLWYYPKRSGFMWQWIFVNLIFLLIIIVLGYIEYGGQPLINLIPAYGGKYIPIVIITGVNYWIFSKKPEELGVSYWILPGILFLLCIILSIGFDNIKLLRIIRKIFV